MFRLTEEQIAFIENDIAVRGISSSDLRVDLLDHICCLIEEELDEYRDFNAVYMEVLPLFGPKGLKEIQQETNRLLTFKHYYIMNATMKISGYVSSILIFIGGFFKTMHWPGAGPTLVLGAVFFTLLFLPLMFVLKYKAEPSDNRSVLLNTVGAISLMLVFTSLLFKLMHWPGTLMLAVAGCSLLLLFYLPIYVAKVYTKTTNKINANSTIIILIAGVGFFLVAAKGDLSKGIVESFVKINNYTNQSLSFIEFQNQKMYQKLNQNKLIDSATSNRLRLLREETEQLDAYIKKLKIYLIAHVEQLSEAEAEEATVRLEDLNTGMSWASTSYLLLNKESGNADYNAYVLKANIEKYKAVLAKVVPQFTASILDTGETGDTGKEPWEFNTFDKQPLALVIYKLTQLELNLKTTESVALNQLL